MNALEARALLFQRKLKELPIDFSIDGLEQLDGQLSVLELKGRDTTQCNKLAEGPDGETDSILMQAAVVCKALVMRDTKERIFSDTDFEGVAEFGLSVLKPIGDLVTSASGLNADALASAKKTLPINPANASNSSFVASSVEETPSAN